jgi:hypothetical protein
MNHNEYIESLIESGMPENDCSAERSDAYPSVKDQLDMLYKDLANGTTTFVDAIQSVKETFPKKEI